MENPVIHVLEWCEPFRLDIVLLSDTNGFQKGKHFESYHLNVMFKSLESFGF